MKVLKLAALFSLSSVIAACATTPALKTMPISIPEIGQKTTKNLGDVLLLQATGTFTKAVQLSGAEGPNTIVPAGLYCNVVGDKYVANGNFEIGVKNAFGKVAATTKTVTFNGEKTCVDGYFSCYTLDEMAVQFYPEKLCVSPNSFQRSIEFNGKSGNVLNFTYREFSGDLARPAFTTNFTMDLSEGDELRYKGAALKIHSANNMEINYSVTRNFDAAL